MCNVTTLTYQFQNVDFCKMAMLITLTWLHKKLHGVVNLYNRTMFWEESYGISHLSNGYNW